MLGLFALYLVAINAAAFADFALDKRAAGRGGRRAPERRLLILAALGGSPAALLAQPVLRHKTRKEPFRTSLRAIAVVHTMILVGVVYRLVR